MAEWISVDDELPDKFTMVDIYVEVKPSGYRGRLIDCYLEGGVWKDRDGDLSDIFQDKVTHFMLSPEPPQTTN